MSDLNAHAQTTASIALLLNCSLLLAAKYMGVAINLSCGVTLEAGMAEIRGRRPRVGRGFWGGAASQAGVWGGL